MLAESDITGALLAMLRLQRVYNLSTSDVAQGQVYHKKSDPLHPDDFYRLGQAAHRSGDYGLAFEWLHLALADPELTIYKPDVLLELAQVHYLVGDYEKAAEVGRQAQEMHPDMTNATTSFRVQTFIQRNISFYLENGNQRPAPLQTADTWQRNLPFWKSNYEILCRSPYPDESLLKRPELGCRIRNPQNYYAWAKEEVLSRDPWIALIHDVVNDRESDRIKEIATPELFRAKVGDPNNAYASEERVSKVAWLWDQTSIDGFIPQISKRIQMITGLSTHYQDPLSNAEPFQVVNYGMGGQYEPHVDFYESKASLAQVPEFLQNTGDRMVTFMLYLSKVSNILSHTMGLGSLASTP